MTKQSKMTFLKSIFILISIFLGMISCTKDNNDIMKSIENELKKVDGDFAFAYKNLENEETLLINENESFHAASTMKTPVMIQLFKLVNDGKIKLEDSIKIENSFKSIIDSSEYKMDFGDDSDDLVYNKIDQKMTVYDLCYAMITVSSNFATNILIDLVGAKETNEYMHNIGAKNIKVLRGVEDTKAFDAGKNNETTALDMLIVFEALANQKFSGSEKMLEILKEQKFKDIIPARLPKEVKVAHKTGSIVGVQHDNAIVYCPNGSKYILILLTKNLKDEKMGVESLSKISELVYKYHMSL